MEKKLSTSSLLIQAMIYLILGILCFHRKFFLWTFIYLIMLLMETGLFFATIFDLFSQKNIHFSSIIKCFALLFCFGFTIRRPDTIGILIPWMIGWYALLIALIQSINYYVFRKDSLRGTFWRFMLFLVSFFFGLILVLNPLNKLAFLSNVAGTWLLFYGIVTLIEAMKQFISESTKQTLRKHMNLSVPILVAAFLPIRAFSSISHLGKSVPIKEKNENDVEVYIYLKGRGPESLGHVDLAFGDTVYSYGLHDPHHRKLFGTFGDGVLIVSDRTSFLKEHVDIEKKVIVSYGIQLTPSQKSTIQNRIHELMSRTIPWKCDYALGHQQATDYASRVYKVTHCNMYKFTERKFKTYFVFSTNCVLLADHLLRCNELDLFDFHGIVTPGSYLNFLNTEYLRNNTQVTSRNIYGQNSA